MRFVIWLACVCLPGLAFAGSEWRQRAAGMESRTFRIGGIDGTLVQAVRLELADFELRGVSAAGMRGRTGIGHSAESVDDMVRWVRGSVGVNGNFFDEMSTPLGLLIDRGQQLYPIRQADWGVFYVQKGQAHLVHTRDFVASDDIEFAIQVGPRTVVDGKPLKLKAQSAHRAALAIDAQGRVIMLCTRGAALESNALAGFMAKSAKEGGLGAQFGVMVDGGPSAQMFAQWPKGKVQLKSRTKVPTAVVAVARPEGGRPGLEKVEKRPQKKGGPGFRVLQGPCDIESVKQALTRQAVQLQYCYERSLRRNPHLRGDVVLQWIISADGRVSEARVTEESLGEASIVSCLASKMRRLRFDPVPKPLDGGSHQCTIEARFIFQPSE
ncbi:MAG: AgmX/PglI C-terminal domain-containing protein [Bradymonadia bacterium]